MLLWAVLLCSIWIANAQQITTEELSRQTKILKEKCNSAPFRTHFIAASVGHEHTLTCFVGDQKCDGAIHSQPQIYRSTLPSENKELKIKGIDALDYSTKLCIFETYFTTAPQDRYTCENDEWTLQAMPKGNPKCFRSELLPRTLSYDQIKAKCSAMGARVASVEHGLDELGIYTSLVKVSPGGRPRDAIYIGLTYRNGWKWEDNKPLRDFTRWIKYQPNRSSYSGQSETCTVQSFEKEGWDDYFCDCAKRNCPGTHKIGAFTCSKEAQPPKQPGNWQAKYECDDNTWIKVARGGGQHMMCEKAIQPGQRYYVQMNEECAKLGAILAPMQSATEERAFKDSLQVLYGPRNISGYVLMGVRNTNPIRTIPGVTFIWDYDGQPMGPYKRWLEPDPNVDQNEVATDFERCNQFDFHWNGWRDWYCTTANTKYSDWYLAYYAVCAKPANLYYR